MERYFRWHCVSWFPHLQNGAITHTAGAACKGASIGTGMRTILHKWQDCSFQNIFPLCPQYQWRDCGSLTWWLNGTEEASTNNLFTHSEDVRVQPIHESSSQAAKQNTLCKSKPQSKPFLGCCLIQHWKLGWNMQCQAIWTCSPSTSLDSTGLIPELRHRLRHLRFQQNQCHHSAQSALSSASEGHSWNPGWCLL